MNTLFSKPITHCVFKLILLSVLVLNTSCSNLVSQQMLSSHKSYNDVVQLTVTREVLANIVRSRYFDPMQFMSVDAINAQFSLSFGGTSEISGVGQNVAGSADASLGYSDSPTITFFPKSDAGFYKSFYSPFELSETIGFGLSYRFAKMEKGWLDLILWMSFSAINGANDFVGGDENIIFQNRVSALVQLIEKGAKFTQVPDWEYDTIALPKSKYRADDIIDIFRNDFSLVEDDDGVNVRLARYRLMLALVIPKPKNTETALSLSVLGVPPGKKYYIFRPPAHALPDNLDSEAIWISPRSMADMMNLATHFVQVPDAHLNMVPPLHIKPTKIPFNLVKINSSEKEPSFPYRIHHRGYWFYVDDTDMMSKMFLESMVAAYSSRIGSRQAGDAKPQVVLPVGGR